MLQGFLNVRMPTWLRRLTTRSAAVIPAALLQAAYGDQGTYRLLVMMQAGPPPHSAHHKGAEARCGPGPLPPRKHSLEDMEQVVLAVALPFTLVPLIKATSSRQLMGAFRNSPTSELLSWAACSVIFLANLLLLLHWLFPDDDDGEDLLDVAVALATQRPLQARPSLTQPPAVPPPLPCFLQNCATKASLCTTRSKEKHA